MNTYHLAVKKGDLEELKKLCEEKGTIDVDKGFNGANLLHTAAIFDKLAILNYLIDKGIDINDKNNNGESACHLAVMYNHFDIFKRLLELNASVAERNKNGYKIIHSAASVGNFNVLKLLLSNGGVDVDDKNNYHETALHLACLKGHYIVVRLLLIFKASTTIQSSLGMLPLHYAAKNGRVDILDLFIEKAYHPLNIQTKDGQSILHLSALNNHLEFVERLIEEKIDLDLKDNKENTALHLAVQYNHRDIMEVLIENGANVCSKNALFMTPIALSISTKYGSDTRWMINNSSFNSLHHAVKDKSQLHLLLKSNNL